MKDLTLLDLMRLQYVTRWNTVPVSKPQSVAEHSWAVAIIALRLADVAEKNGEWLVGEVNRGALAIAALYHDAPEVFTGDISTPTKMYLKRIPDVTEALDELENTAGDEYIESKLWKGGRADDILKLADLYESWLYLREYGVGNYTYRQEGDLKKRIDRFAEEKKLTETYRWLKEHTEQFRTTDAFSRVDALMGTKLGE